MDADLLFRLILTFRTASPLLTSGTAGAASGAEKQIKKYVFVLLLRSAAPALFSPLAC
jgi:hypothetical protein